MRSATVGQILVNETLPPEMRDYDRVLDKKGLRSLMEEVAEKHPERYREIAFALNQIGRRGAQESGSVSFGLQHLKSSKSALETLKKIREKLKRILQNNKLSQEQLSDAIVRAVGTEMQPQQQAIYQEALQGKNPLALQVASGTRGKVMNLASLLGRPQKRMPGG